MDTDSNPKRARLTEGRDQVRTVTGEFATGIGPWLNRDIMQSVVELAELRRAVLDVEPSDLFSDLADQYRRHVELITRYRDFRLWLQDWQYSETAVEQLEDFMDTIVFPELRSILQGLIQVLNNDAEW